MKKLFIATLGLGLLGCSAVFANTDAEIKRLKQENELLKAKQENEALKNGTYNANTGNIMVVKPWTEGEQQKALESVATMEEQQYELLIRNNKDRMTRAQYNQIQNAREFSDNYRIPFELDVLSNFTGFSYAGTGALVTNLGFKSGIAYYPHKNVELKALAGIGFAMGSFSSSSSALETGYYIPLSFEVGYVQDEDYKRGSPTIAAGIGYDISNVYEKFELYVKIGTGARSFLKLGYVPYGGLLGTTVEGTNIWNMKTVKKVIPADSGFSFALGVAF